MRVPRWALCAVWSESELSELGGMEHQRVRRGAVGAVAGVVTLVPGRVLMASVPKPSVPRPLGSTVGVVESVGDRGGVGSEGAVGSVESEGAVTGSTAAGAGVVLSIPEYPRNGTKQAASGLRARAAPTEGPRGKTWCRSVAAARCKSLAHLWCAGLVWCLARSAACEGKWTLCPRSSQWSE